MNRFFPLLLIALVIAAPAHAQYSWIDEHGTRVFSDRPPPPGTPPSRILKAPRPAAASAHDAAPAPADAAQPAAPTLAEREAEFRKRAAQRDADDRKATEDAQQRAAQAEQCAAARRNEAALTSGARLTDVDEHGEHVVVTGDDRSRRLAQVRRVLAGCR